MLDWLDRIPVEMPKIDSHMPTEWQMIFKYKWLVVGHHEYEDEYGSIVYGGCLFAAWKEDEEVKRINLLYSQTLRFRVISASIKKSVLVIEYEMLQRELNEDDSGWKLVPFWNGTISLPIKNLRG